MKTKIILIFSLLINFSLVSPAQNLVPNWSFEDTVACPSGIGNGISLAFGWFPWRNTPDLFHTCTNSQAGIPQNFMGFQYPKTGVAYAGFYTYTKNALNYREILGIELTQPLIIWQKYFLSFYVSNGINPANYINGATNKIGARLSTVSFSQSSVTIDNYAHVYTDSVIIDSIGWFKISGSFIADSAYKYLGIGNFFTDSASSQIFFDSTSVLVYYYIDDIRLSTDTSYVNGTVNFEQNDFYRIFPNPARDWITIEGRGITKISLFDILGKICLSYPVSASSFKIDVSSLGKGIYFLNIETGQENIIKKLVIH